MTTSERSWQGRLVLVTGGLGFVGSALTRALVRVGARVRVLDSLLPQGGGSPRALHEAAGHVEVIIEDTRSRDVVNRAVVGCDHIVHLAGHDGVSALAQDLYSAVDIACIGTLNVLDAVRLHAPRAQLVFASSLAVYGRSSDLPLTEDAPTDPDTLFGVHKLTGEKYCGLYRREYGTRTTVARIGTVFGPGQQLRSAASDTLAYAIDAILHREPIQLAAGGTARHDVLYIDDAVAALMQLMVLQTNVPLLNIGRGESLTLRQLAEALVAAVNGDGVIRDRAPIAAVSHPMSGVVADCGRLGRLGITIENRSVVDALRETVAWYRGVPRAP
jgi:UDP-glucose 4-epimerase